MRVALDAMGGDHAPRETVLGAVEAARLYGLEVLLVGQEGPVRTELERHRTDGLRLRVVPASQVIEMAEHPTAALRGKPDSSLAVAVNLVKDGQADAFVSAGNSGAVMALAIFRLGRIPGVERPAIGTTMPTLQSPAFVVDMGANADCRPAHLLQFGAMGSAFMERVMHVARPRVALLSIGEEETKGSQLVQEAHALLRASDLHFVGNMEGKDVLRGGADVLVTDGFTGNVILKWSEGMAEVFLALLRQAMRSKLHYRLAAAVMRPGLRRAFAKLDFAEVGAAPLLGVEGVVLVAHGRSNARAIANALRRGAEMAEAGVAPAVRAGLAARTP